MGKGRQDPGIWRTVYWVPLPLPLSICVVVVSLRPPISLSPIFLSGLFLQWPRFDLPHSTIAVAPLTQTPASLLCSSFLVLPSLTHSLSLSLYVFIYNNNNFRFCTGGTAFNGVVEELKNFTTRVAHVLPVSDDGGSTAEIVRVLGKFFFLFLMNEFLVFAQQFYFMVSVHFFFPAIRWSGCWRHKVEVFEVVGSKQCWGSCCPKIAWSSFTTWCPVGQIRMVCFNFFLFVLL